MGVLQGMTGVEVAIWRGSSLPLLMHRVLQLFHIINLAIQLPQNKVKAFTFV
eukprot:GDKH01017871.1.p2 GENE.GDKH01017871.1~~GDKH01017871.1.p2  ORF type:complete len:52 (+),score=0.12 GDKH01017871.1:111-266(+)